MKLAVQFVLGVLVLGTSLFASAADVAVLRNGFSIRHERREIVGSVTRLYMGSDTNGFVDVRTDDIDHFEVDFSVPAAAHSTPSVDATILTLTSSTA
jgi:hypothetical protein